MGFVAVAVEISLILLLTVLCGVKCYDMLVNCRSPLGMESGAIPDSVLSASPSFDGDYNTYGPQRARLNLKESPYYGYRAERRSRSGGSAQSNVTWIMVKLQNETVITGVSTQGYGVTEAQEWVTKYTLRYSTGNELFYFRERSGEIKKFRGNFNSDGVEHHNVPLPVITSTVMLLPLDWNNNAGLRMELYGCAPGYYFLARLKIADRREFFTLAFADKSSNDYQTWSADITDEVQRLIGNVPGFLRVKLRRFRLSSDSDRALVLAEFEIHCIKEAASFVAGKLENSVVPTDRIFQTGVYISFPGDSSCFFPDVDILLDGTKVSAKKVLTISQLTLHPVIALCDPQPMLIQASSLWEKSIIVGDSPLLFQKFGEGMEQVFNPRMNCTDCYPVSLYLRFTAHVKEPQEKTLESFILLEVDQPELVAKIGGPVKAARGIGNISLDASKSFDPDSFAEGELSFSWFCKSKKHEVFSKETCQYASTASDGKIFLVDVNKLKSNHLYEFKLVVSKGTRKRKAIHALTVLPSVNFTFRCRVNCGKKVLQSKTMRIEPKCEGKLCDRIIRTKWSIHALNSTVHSRWCRRASTFVVKDFSSHVYPSKTRDPRYKIKAVIVIRVENEDIKEEYHEEIILNSTPFIADYNRGCFVTPNEGYAVETIFNITCLGWRDEDKPLKYEFRYNTSDGLIINDPNVGTGKNILSTNLPVGNKAHDFVLRVDVYVKDSLGDFTISSVAVKVKDKYSEDVARTLDKIANNESNKFTTYIDTNKPTEAFDVAISVLSLVEQRRRTSGSEGEDDADQLAISKEKVRKLKDNIIDELRRIKIDSKELITKVSTAVAMATKERDEISQESQEQALERLDEATDFLSKLMDNYTEDAITLTKVSKNLLLGLGNILNISSQDASVISMQTTWYKIDKEKSKTIAQKALKTIWKLRDCLVVDEGGDEPVVINSRYLSIVLYRQDTLTNETMIGEAKTKFTLPTYEGIFKRLGVEKADITSKIVLFKGNPYTWHISAFKVSSWVVDVVLQTEEKRNLNVSGLEKPVHLYIPHRAGNGSPTDMTKNSVQYFVKPSYEIYESKLIQYHKINIADAEDVVSVKLHPEKSGAPLRVYVSSSDFPTPTEHNFSIVLPCKKEERKCNIDRYVFSFNASDTGNTGTHYIGIHYYVNITYDVMFQEEGKMISMNGSVQERPRRSSDCDSRSGRQKRSCIGVKDPPPPPTPAPIVLRSKYNASTDLNYTLSVTIGSCLYWSEDKEQWTNEGCKLVPETVSGSIHCLCYHLSAFGGDFFVEPNKIEFKKVFGKFGDLGETKNFVVLATVCSMLLLYTIGLIFTRRADRRDKEKTIPNVYLLDSEEKGQHHYRISVQTGMWVGSGTTANVGIIIYGEDCYSDQIILTDSACKKMFFARASVNTFTVSLSRSLGPLYKIKVWHDNSGESPGWFLRDFVITELGTQEQWHFLANRWLAVEKGRGEVEIQLKTSNKEETSNFKSLFYSRASKQLADGHLWISVLTRPPQSLFTRTQRFSCCMSVFFLAMITNAMFYDFGEEAKDTFQLGPLTMSWTQVKIGIQSAMIALPVNVLIVTVFRNVKPKNKRKEDYDIEGENSSKGLPHLFVYIAWIMCILAILSSAFFTVLYSLSWGAKISNEWLTSILVSFFQDVVILQPIQVVVIASLLSILIRKPVKHDPVHGLPRKKNPCEEDSKVQPPEETVLKTSRTFRKKLQKMFRAILEISLFLFFILLLFIVCYGNRETSRYQLTKSLKDIFVKFDKRVNSTATFWNWTRQKLVPGLFLSEWYNGQQVDLDEGFLSSGYPFLVGMPRLRQIRVQPDACQVDDYVRVQRCLPYYTSQSEDKTAYSLRDWIPVANITEFEVSFKLDDLCPKPWRYRTADSLETLSFHGYHAVYGGGGYVADLGYNAESALGVIHDLENNSWIDDRTFAVFIEFTVYEPSSTLFSAGKYLYERYPTGGTKTTGTIETLMIYYPIDPSYRFFYLACQLLFIFLIFGLFVMEIVKLYFQGCRYFTHFWNLVDILQISSAMAAIVSYFFKAKYTSDFVRRVRKNPFDTSSSDHIVQWCDLEIWLLSLVAFLVTIKMLRLLKFNDHICHLTYTVKSAVRHLVSYSLVFTATLVAYTQLGTLLFGSNVSSYSSMTQSLRMLLERLLGNNMYTNELKAVNDVMGQLFTLAYSFSIGMILINMFLSILYSSYSEIRRIRRGRFPDVELAHFAWQYFIEKLQTFWDDTKKSLKRTKKVEKPHLKREKAKYFSVPRMNALEDSDEFFRTTYHERKSTEECRCLSAEEIQFEEATIEEFDDIDLADEYSSLRDVRKTLFQIGTSFFLTKNEWSSGSLSYSDDDRDDTSSLRSEWSYGKESNQMQSLFSLNRIESDSLEDDIDELVEGPAKV